MISDEDCELLKHYWEKREEKPPLLLQRLTNTAIKAAWQADRAWVEVQLEQARAWKAQQDQT